MRILIVEDEAIAAENLTYMLRREAPDVRIAGCTESVEETVAWLASNSADLIFMDIHLSDGSAFNLFDRCEVTTPIIFTTAYDQYALEAFRVNSVDYLLKPVNTTDLRRALDKFRRRTPAELMRYVASLGAMTARQHYPDRILVQHKDRIVPLDVRDVACVYSTNRHTEIILRSGSLYATTHTLDKIMSELDPKQFIRANKQFIVSRDAIRDLTVWFDSRLKVNLTVPTPEDIYISKNRVADFKAWLISR